MVTNHPKLSLAAGYLGARQIPGFNYVDPVNLAATGANMVAKNTLNTTLGPLSPYAKWDAGNETNAQGDAVYGPNGQPLQKDRNEIFSGVSNDFLGMAGGAVLLPMLAAQTGIPAPILAILGAVGGYKMLPYLINKMRDPSGYGANSEPFQGGANYNVHGSTQYPSLSPTLNPQGWLTGV